MEMRVEKASSRVESPIKEESSLRTLVVAVVLTVVLSSGCSLERTEPVALADEDLDDEVPGGFERGADLPAPPGVGEAARPSRRGRRAFP